MTTLIVWFSNEKGARKVEVACASHQDASLKARTTFKGMRTKILSSAPPRPRDMRSACDVMAGWMS